MDERAEHTRRARALLRTRRCWPPDSSAAPRSAAWPATGIAIASGNIAEVRGARPRGPAPTRWLHAARQTGWRKNSARRASAYRRSSPQTRTRSAPAPRRAASDASKATRRYGAWLLTRTQQLTFLSKHAASKQPLNPAKSLQTGQSGGHSGTRRLAGSLRRPRSRRPRKALQFAGDAWQRRYESDVHQLPAIETGVGPDDTDQGL